MTPWDTYEHNDAYDDLKTIVNTATSMGAEPSSCGKRKLTIRWPDGGIVHIRRFLNGEFRWLIFTQAGRQAVFLANRDPNLRELQGSCADSHYMSLSGRLDLTGMGAVYPEEALTPP